MAGGGRGGPDNTPIDAELNRAGGFGRFQIFIILTVVFGIMSVNLLTHGIAILELPPQEPNGFLCTDDKSPSTSYPCEPEDFCGVDGISYDVNYAESNENIYNWYTKLDLVCKPKSATSYIAISCMVGIFLGVIVIPRLGDLIGRKPVFQAALIGSLPCLALVTFTSKVFVVDIGAFLAGPCIIARMSCGFLMLMEHMPSKHQAKVGAVVMVSEGCCQVLWVFFLAAISKDTFYFMYFAIALNLVTCIACYWVPESPRYLYGINNLEKCKETFAYIAKMNGVTDYEMPEFHVEFEIECVDRDTAAGNDSRPGTQKEKLLGQQDGNFDSLLSQRDRETTSKAARQTDKESQEQRGTATMGRYLTVSNNKAREDGTQASINRLTKRETVAYMHATVTGIRQSAHLWVIGADKTQSIALDEVFSKKPVHDGIERSTMTFRNTGRTTQGALQNASPHSSTELTVESQQIEVPTTVMRSNGLCQGRTAINLILMVCLWVVSCVSYGMINIYMKYVPGTIYLNFSVSGLSEILAHIVVGLFYVKLTPRWTFFIGYLVAVIGGICLIFQKRYDNGALVAVFVLLAKFGASMAMCSCYVSTPYIFPVLLSGTAFGICNIFGRFFAIAAPYVAETAIPFPMEVFSVLSLLGMVVCLFISTSKDEEVELPRSSQASRNSKNSKQQVRDDDDDSQ